MPEGSSSVSYFSPQWVLFYKVKIAGGFRYFKVELCGLWNKIFFKNSPSFNLDWLALVSFLQPIRNVFSLAQVAVHLSVKLKCYTPFMSWYIVGQLFYFPLFKLRPKSDKLVVAYVKRLFLWNNSGQDIGLFIGLQLHCTPKLYLCYLEKTAVNFMCMSYPLASSKVSTSSDGGLVREQSWITGNP